MSSTTDQSIAMRYSNDSLDLDVGYGARATEIRTGDATSITLAWRGDSSTLTVRQGVISQSSSAVARYLAIRRARIAGRKSVQSIGEPAMRVDVAAHSAYERARDELGGELHPSVFTHEIVETFERWVAELYQRGFFRAVFTQTLRRDQYVYAISNMHQFVRWTTRLLGLAVGHSHDRELRDHFVAHLQGEINHELIIERDLAHLGEDVAFVVDDMAASPGTRHFMAVQESMIGHHRDPILFLASPLAAEGVASHLTPAFITALERNIASWDVRDPRQAMMFFRSHVHTDGGDDGHWELVIRMLQRHLTTESRTVRFLGVLRASMAALTEMYDEVVQDLAG